MSEFYCVNAGDTLIADHIPDEETARLIAAAPEMCKLLGQIVKLHSVIAEALIKKQNDVLSNAYTVHCKAINLARELLKVIGNYSNNPENQPQVQISRV